MTAKTTKILLYCAGALILAGIIIHLSMAHATAAATAATGTPAGGATTNPNPATPAPATATAQGGSAIDLLYEQSTNAFNQFESNFKTLG